MPKLNRGYIAFFDYPDLAYLENEGTTSKTIDEKLYSDFANKHQTNKLNLYLLNPYKDAYLHIEPRQYAYLHDIDDERSQYELKDQLRGGLQPFADMVKDVVDTFKPYKSEWYAGRDAAQLIYGVVNISIAALSVIGTLGLFILNTTRYACSPSTFTHNMKANLIYTGSWLLDSVTTAIRGVTQIITAPLTWARIFLRVGITLLWPDNLKIENSKSIQRLVSKSEAANNSSMELIIKELHRKYMKERSKEVKTSITSNDESNAYKSAIMSLQNNALSTKTSKDERQAVDSYLRLFNNPTTSKEQTNPSNLEPTISHVA
ncbi:MAG TPA: hypothetical protein VJN02_00490 [Gammaproteobacteria bacterium]|nr:hypothetical protein [Gammaproteobacteria bacterium]